MSLRLLIIGFLCVCLYVQGADKKQVVSEMQVSVGDSVFKYNYLYNNDTIIVVETKALKTASGWKNMTQKEWFPQAGVAPRMVERKWNNNVWQDTYSIDYSLADGKLTETHDLINGTERTTLTSIETTYNNNKKEKVTNYSYSAGRTMKNSEHLFFYGNELPDSTIQRVFLNGGVDTTAYKTVYTYNPDNTYKQVTVLKLKNGSVWENETKTNWYYFANTQKVRSERNYIWNGKINNWENATKLEYEYDGSGKTTEETGSVWGTMVWSPLYRYSYIYDVNGNVAKKEMYFPIFRAWRNAANVNFTQAAGSRNLTIESVYGFWGGKAGEKLTSHIAVPFNDETIVRNGHTIVLTYTPFVGTQIPDNQNQELQFIIYPNPTSGILYIENYNATTCRWMVCSVSGKLMKKSSGESFSSIVDITDFPNGIYLITVLSPKGQQTRKIVKY